MTRHIARDSTSALASIRKATRAQDCLMLEQIPNIGAALAADLRRIDVMRPCELIQRDAFALYFALCHRTGVRHAPCVLDAFLAACDFMRGAPPAPWWRYTGLRKRRYGAALSAVLSRNQRNAV